MVLVRELATLNLSEDLLLVCLVYSLTCTQVRMSMYNWLLCTLAKLVLGGVTVNGRNKR